jgi:signal peptidase II
MRRLSTFCVLLLVLFTVGCDQSTKSMAISQFQDLPLTIMPGVQLTYAENHDMAFGLLTGLLDEEVRLWLLSGAKILAIVVGSFIYVRRRAIATRREQAGIGFVLAGAVGNLMDRLNHGFVVDFLQVPHWPIFNVADVAIVAGFGLLILDSWILEHSRGRGKPKERVTQRT